MKVAWADYKRKEGLGGDEEGGAECMHLLGAQLVVIARHSPRRLTEVPLVFFVAVDIEHVVHRRTVLVPLALTEQNKTKTFQS